MPDLICVTEHWMIQSELNMLYVRNYKLVSSFAREKSIHGGTCILVRECRENFENVPCLEDLSIEGHIEIACAVDKINKIIVLSIYRTCLGNVKTFIDVMEQIINILGSKFLKFNIAICGDFNINLMKNSKDKTNFLEVLKTLNLQQTIFSASRVTKTSVSLLDNIFTNAQFYSCSSNIDSTLSDHKAQFVQIETNEITREGSLVMRRLFSKSKIEQFIQSLNDYSWTDILRELDPNKAYGCFSEIMKFQLNLIFPIKKIYQKKKTNTTWITMGIRTSSKNKKRIYNDMLQGRETPEYYKKYSSILKQVVKQAKKKSNESYIKQAENRAKATWTLVNNITQKKNMSKNLFKSFTNQSEKDTLNDFNKNFINISSLNPQNNNYEGDYIKICNKSIFLEPVLEQEVFKYIMNLKNKRSVGPDNIPVKILKESGHIITKPLTHIINQMLSTGIYPEELKEAWVKAVYKKGDQKDKENYRPISLLSNVNKIIEKILFDKFTNFFEKNSLLVQEQCGFRKGKSTIHAIYKALQSAIKSVNEKNFTVAICLDLTKAFDRVDHSILIRKLEKYGIRGICLKLMKSYLSERKQRVIEINKDGETIISDPMIIKQGVPQGSILGPLLYIIYTNEIVNLAENEAVMYADDISLICKAQDREVCKSGINRDLEEINKWLLQNHLLLNVEKTKMMVFRENNDQSFEISTQNTKIKTVENISFLGIIIDQNLNWKAHIDLLAANISKYCYALRVIGNTIGVDAAMSAFHGYVQSQIGYGVIFWARSTEADRIFKLQKRCLRIIFSMKQNESCKNVFIENSILTLYGRYIYECIIFIMKNYDDFKKYELKHIYNTRNKNILIQEKTDSTYIQKNASYSLFEIWNKLPDSFKSIINFRNIQSQKFKLKKFLLKKCYYKLDAFLQEKDFVGL